MPKGVSKKVKIRAAEVAYLLRIRGCVTTRAVVELGFTKTQAEAALRYLAASGRAVRVGVGRVAVWCYSEKSAARHMARLRRALHRLICAAKLKYVSPIDVLEIITGDKEARRLFTRYIKLSVKDTAALHFLSGLLTFVYGEPVFMKSNRKPVYFAYCGRRRLPPLRYGRKEYRSVQVKVEPELREALLKIAEAEGVSVSALVRRAVERLLERHRIKR